MKRLLSILLVLMMLVPAALADEGTTTYAVISHPSANYITLRETPSDSATSLGKFYNGTYVSIVSYYDTTWAEISVNPDSDQPYTGYVKRAFLQTDYINNAVKSTAPAMTLQNSQGKGVLLRSTPTFMSDSSNVLGLYGNGTQILVLGDMSNWYYVQVGGRVGFMAKTSFTAKTATAASTTTNSNWNNGPVGSHVSANWNIDIPTNYAIVNNPYAGDRLNLRREPSTSSTSLGKYYNGVYVEVLATLDNGFTQVRIGNLTGYMKTEYLSTSSVASAMPLLKINSSGKVNLRESASTSSNSLGQYPKDTEVILLGFNGNWAHVIVDGKIGFMLTTYLK
jgi:uncharacterized protein YgiM (DUF1202 family)